MGGLKIRLQRNVQRLFQRLQVPCSSEISFISVGNTQVPSWEFDQLDREAWAEEHAGKGAAIGIVLGYQDGDGFRCFEEELAGKIVVADADTEELEGWDCIFQVKGFDKTLQELEHHKAMLNVRRRAYLRIWTSVSGAFEEKDEDEAKFSLPSMPMLRRSSP